MKWWAIFFNAVFIAVMANKEQQPDVCPAVYQPVCSSNGMTYSNMCYFNVANKRGSMKVVYNGSCEAHNCFRRCPHTPLNVCGTDGETYGSECALKCTKIDRPEKSDVTVAYRGRCKKDCICYLVYDPVCGSNGKTYSNDCFFKCENEGTNVIIAYKGKCKIGHCT